MVNKSILNIKNTFFRTFQIERDTRKKIDPKDYTLENKTNETFIKMPGSINGMQFLIQNLEVFDFSKFYEIESRSQKVLSNKELQRLFI
jgi:hypothetical protein